jgi:hypothetical protein
MANGDRLSVAGPEGAFVDLRPALKAYKAKILSELSQGSEVGSRPPSDRLAPWVYDPDRAPRPEVLGRARWLVDRLTAAGGPVPLPDLLDAAGAAGVVGLRDLEQDGPEKCPLDFRLWDARDAVPLLPAPRDGRRVIHFRAPFRGDGPDVPHWRLIDQDPMASSSS